MCLRKTLSFGFKRTREEITGLFCENFFVSYPRTGRTWVRGMLQDYSALAGSAPVYAIKENTYQLDTLSYEMNGKARRIIFSHDVADHPYVKYLRPDNFEELFRKSKYKGKKVFLLLRHPGDIAASHFELLKMLQKRGDISDMVFPQDLETFILSPEFGVPKIASYYRHWLDFLQHSEGYVRDYKVSTYEAFRTDPQAELSLLLEFFGVPLKGEILAAAIEKNSAAFIKENRESDVAAIKLKNAKVKGYTDKISNDAVLQIDRVIQENALRQYA